LAVSEEYRTMSRLGPLAFDATSVTLIEAAAGLAAGSGAPYHHFRSKEPLLEAVATAFAAVLPARFRTGRTWYAQVADHRTHLNASTSPQAICANAPAD
jgi:AcrR family transcriptional regulator